MNGTTAFSAGSWVPPAGGINAKASRVSAAACYATVLEGVMGYLISTISTKTPAFAISVLLPMTTPLSTGSQSYRPASPTETSFSLLVPSDRITHPKEDEQFSCALPQPQPPNLWSPLVITNSFTMAAHCVLLS